MKIRKRDLIKVVAGAVVMTGGIYSIARRDGIGEGFEAGRTFGHLEVIKATADIVKEEIKTDK